MVLFQDLTDPAVLLSLGDEIATHAENTRHAGPWKSGVFHLFARTGILAAFIPISFERISRSGGKRALFVRCNAQFSV